MSYAADYALSQSAPFQQQIQMSVYKAAVAIAQESRTIHPLMDAKRHTLSAQILSNFTGLLLTQFTSAAIEAGALVTGATDAQVDTAVATCWNGVAGVSAADQA
jgi:hypothetical protein